MIECLGVPKNNNIKSVLHNYFRNDREIRHYKSHHSLRHHDFLHYIKE